MGWLIAGVIAALLLVALVALDRAEKKIRRIFNEELDK